PEDWRHLIRHAGSEEDIVQLVRDHLAMWSPEEIARLPIDCRPARVSDGDDVSRWAYTLALTHCSGAVSEADEPLVDRMLEFVTQAAVRLAALRTAAKGSEADAPLAS